MRSAACESEGKINNARGWILSEGARHAKNYCRVCDAGSDLVQRPARRPSCPGIRGAIAHQGANRAPPASNDRHMGNEPSEVEVLRWRTLQEEDCCLRAVAG